MTASDKLEPVTEFNGSFILRFSVCVRACLFVSHVHRLK